MKKKSGNHKGLVRAAALGIAVLLLVIDQITKYFVLANLKPNGPVTVIEGLLEFSYVENTGAAFGLFKNHMWIVTVITALAFLTIIVALFRYRAHTFFSYSSLVLLLAGGVGNLIDRLRYGFVVDYIHVMFFDYIFNFADCCITVGAGLFILHVLLGSRRENPEKELEDGEE